MVDTVRKVSCLDRYAKPSPVVTKDQPAFQIPGGLLGPPEIQELRTYVRSILVEERLYELSSALRGLTG